MSLIHTCELNENPKPFIWTADADVILGKVGRLPTNSWLRARDEVNAKASAKIWFVGRSIPIGSSAGLLT